MGRYDRYSSFKNISEQLCKKINCGDYCDAQKFFAHNNDNFTIQEVLRFKMDRYSSDSLLIFAEYISLDKSEIEQYKYYFREKNRLDSYRIPSTARLDPIYVFSKVSEKMGQAPFQTEYYTSYINYFISTHKDSFWSSCRFAGNKEKLSQKCEEMYKKRYIIEHNLCAFRMNFCDFHYNDRDECICKFKNEMDLKIKLAASDANVATNIYTIAYTMAGRSTVQEFVNETKPVMYDLLTHRKWYGYENYTLRNINIEVWIKAYLCLLFRSIKAIEASQMVVNISKETVETDFCDVDIPVEYVETILDYLSIEYSKYSQKEQIDDYREKPLLRYKGCIYLIPYVISSSDVINIILRESQKENRTKIDKRGITYENVTRDKWRKVVGIVENCKGFDKTTNTHNECDMAFVFDDCLFICELKNEAQAYSYKDWKKFEIRKGENIDQLMRITEYFKNNNKLKRALNKKPSWEPRKVISLLLYSGACGKPQKLGDGYVANEQDVFCFFKKVPIGQIEIIPQSKMYNYISSYLPGYDYLENQEHKLTIGDFDAYMKLPMCTKQLISELERDLADSAERV